MTAEEELLLKEKLLEEHAFTYRGGGYWHDAVTSEIYTSSVAFKVLMQRLGAHWHKDSLGDYVIRIDRPGCKVITGKIIRCPITQPYKKIGYNTQSRWLLLVNDHAYGFWKTMHQAMDKFQKDCVPKPKETTTADRCGDYYCWHGDKPYGPGPYCTGCGGLIKK